MIEQPSAPPPRRSFLAKLKIFVLGFFLGALILAVWREWRKPPAPTWNEREAITQKLNADMKELAAQIQSLQGKSQCNSTADCRVVGLGAETCNGYRNFIIYSRLDADEGALLYAIKRFNAGATQLADLSLESASCGYVASEVVCVKARCVPKGREAAP